MNDDDTRTDAALAVTRTGADAGDATARGARLEPGARIGRFFVLGRIGAGGYGEVVRAYDPQLDRKVALKLLLPERTPAGRRRAALLREAQALAKLSHPGVVAIHEIGEADGRTYIAMELVEGVDLAGWLATPREWQDALALVLAAGEGLAAAHAAGVVHRDFKPANVLIGTSDAGEGRPRVADFGLALVGERDEDGVPLRGDGGADTPVASSPTVAGTPVYMAPEIWAGAAATAASDQYAFFVTLYEAIFGAHPWVDATVHELRRTKLEEAVVLPERPAIPGWLRRALAIGLERDPARRHPSLASAIESIRRRLSRRRSGPFAIVASVVVVAVAAAIAWPAAARWRRCEHGEALVEATWDDARRERVREAFGRAAPVLGPESFPALDERLRTYVADWGEAHARACHSSTASADASWQSLEPDLRCLRQRLFVVDAWIERLAVADEAAVERALPAIAALPQPRDCAGVAARDALVAPPPAARSEEVEDVRRTIAETTVMLDAGAVDPARGRVDELLAHARAIDYAPLVAEALFLRGAVEATRGDPRAAAAEYEAALWIAEGAQHDELVVRSASALVRIVGVVLAQGEDGRRWYRHGAAMLQRSAPRPELDVELRSRLGGVELTDGRVEAGERAIRDALELATSVHGPDHTTVGTLAGDLGGALVAREAYAEAEPYLLRDLEIQRGWLPPHHPRVVAAMHNLGALALARGRYGDAKQWFEDTLALQREVHREHHPAIAMTLTNLGTAELELGELEAAERHAREGLEETRASLGPDHPRIGASLVNVGQIRLAAGDVAGAIELTTAAYEHLVRVRGPTHPDVVRPLLNLGAMHREAGALEQARECVERAREIDVANGNDDVETRAYYARELARIDD
jgi:eukaryotic-like serine/threonine-protein kinase